MDEFAELTERHRRELHVHCYRMLASFDEAQDAVQETFLRAWRSRDSFDGSGQFRAWLYRIATNVCLDLLRSRRSVTKLDSFAEVPWLQPYPDRLLDEVLPAPADDEPEQVAIRRETISLAFLAALQVLPPRQRAALIARDVLGWPAADTARVLGTSVPAANSALQRARATMARSLPPSRAEWTAAEPTAEERALVAQFIEAHERCDTEAAMALVATDIRITMPPQPFLFEGSESMRPLLARAAEMGTWRLVPASANRMPAAASYLRAPGDSEFRAFKLDVMRISGGVFAEITTFGAELFPFFGLPPELAAPAGLWRPVAPEPPPVAVRVPRVAMHEPAAPDNYDRLVRVAEGRSPVTTDVPVLLRQGARAVAAGRVALGLTALAWPGVVARPWVGSADSVTGRVFGRALGGRDLALGLGAVIALESHSDDASSWVAAGALCDTLDVAASLASWRELPRFTRWLVLASAGGAAVAGAAGAVALRGSRKPVSDDQAPETGQAA